MLKRITGVFILIFAIVGTAYAGSIKLPQTGQATCYDSAGKAISCKGTGQDGEFQSGMTWPSPRFSDNGDRTITDKLTGLVWIQDGSAPTFSSWFSSWTPSSWFSSCTGGQLTWQGALDYVACLNAKKYNGHNDWTLPNINELETLANELRQSNASDWLNGIGFTNVRPEQYWSSTTTAYAKEQALYMDMNNGFVWGNPKSKSYYALPVRAGGCGSSFVSCIPKTGQSTKYATGDDGDLRKGVSWPSPRFTDNGDQTVTDNLTSLIWTKDLDTLGPSACKPGNTKLWQEALDFVGCMNTNKYLGHNDWRLPNRKELLSLHDYSKANFISGGTPFISSSGNTYWSSTSDAGRTETAWGIWMNSAMTIAFKKSSDSYKYNVCPVSGGIVKK